MIHLILKLIGCDISSEVSTNIGRIDSVIEFPEQIYIIEFKMTSSEHALRQIKGKKYYESYMGTNKKIILLGIAFDKTNRNIKDYKIEYLDS